MSHFANARSLLAAGVVATMTCAAQGETVAYYQFNEGAGQLIANIEGSSTLTLMLGQTEDADTRDAAWATGLSGGAIHNEPSKPGPSTYAMNTTTWTTGDITSMAPSGSYSVETIVSFDTFDTWNGPLGGTYGFLAYKDGSTVQYLFRMHLSGSDHLLSYVSGSTTLSYTTESKGMALGTDAWYYFGAIYDSTAGQVELIVRDMATEQTVTGTYALGALPGMSGTPTPYFLAGSENLSGRTLDGLVDAIRISDQAVAEGNRLYDLYSALHPGDANGDGMVNLADLQILGDNWQSTTAAWAEADFTGDGNVNLADLQIIGDNWGFGVSSDVSFDEALSQVAIPEPATCLMLGAGSLLLVLRKC